MVQIVGTYEWVSQDNYEAYLKALGLNDEKVQKVSGAHAPVIISNLTDSAITASYVGKEIEFALNKETEHTLPTGTVVKTHVSINGNTITFKTRTADGKVSDERVIEVTDSGLKATSTVNGVTAIRQYKRV